MVQPQPSGPDPTPTARRIVVQFDLARMDRSAVEDRAATLASRVRGAHVVRVSPRGRAVLSVPPTCDVAATTADLAGDPEVVYAEPDTVDRAQ